MSKRKITSRAAFERARQSPEPPLNRKHDLPDPKPPEAEPNRDAFDRHWRSPVMSADDFKEQRRPPEAKKDFDRSIGS